MSASELKALVRGFFEEASKGKAVTFAAIDRLFVTNYVEHGGLRKIDAADVVYVVDPEGYIGKNVSVDIGFAYAKNKSIYVMHRVDDPPVMDLVNAVLSPKSLIEVLKERFSP